VGQHKKDIDMIKKLMLLAMAVCALAAFAAPAIAQADELVETVGGEPVPLEVGAEITLTSTNLVTVGSIGTLECELVTIHGEVTENGPVIEGEEISTSVSGCNHNISDPTAGDVSLSGGTGSSTGTKFVVDFFCTFTGSIPFEYSAPTDEVVVTGSNQLSSGCGSGTMSGSFNIETSDETPVEIIE
jgi:hypothetical protein